MKLKAGTYRFNDNIGFLGVDVDKTFSFTSNGVLYDYMITDGLNDNSFALLYGSNAQDPIIAYTIGVSDFANGWQGNYQEHTIDEQDVDETFGNWYIANTNYNEVNAPKPLAEITYNGETIAQLNAGETAILKCDGLPMETDIIVKVNG